MKNKSVSILILVLLIVGMMPLSQIFPVFAVTEHTIYVYPDAFTHDVETWTPYGVEPWVNSIDEADFVYTVGTGTFMFYWSFDDINSTVFDGMTSITYQWMPKVSGIGIYRTTIYGSVEGDFIMGDNSVSQTSYDVLYNNTLISENANQPLMDYFTTIDDFNAVEIGLYALTGGLAKWLNFIRFVITYEVSALSLTADLEDVDDDGADWVFTDWKYYDFTLTMEGYFENCFFRMDIPTSFESVTVKVFANSTYSQMSSDLSYETREGQPIKLGATSFSYSSETDQTTAVFPIWFESMCLDLWIDSDGIDVYGSYNSSEYELLESSFFRIYSKGGFILNTESSNSIYAYLLDGGTPFSFHVEDEGVDVPQWMYNEIWWRDVQHLKLLPEIHFLAGYEEFTIKYGCDYSLGDGEWETGWWLNIQPDFVSYTALFASNVWINMTTTYNDRDEIARVIDSQYMFYHGSVANPGDPGQFKVWIDLWFSDKNASSVGAARMNAYEFPMIDLADLWLRWLANNWGVKDNVDWELQGESALLDADDTTILSSERIKMVRYWCNVTVYSGGAGQIIEIQGYDAFDATYSKQLPLTGISTPVFDETIMPTVGQKGILGALWTMFAGLGSWLSENVIFGGLNLWSTFVDFLDTIAAMVGHPKFFTNLFVWMAELIGYMADSAGYIGTIATSIFSLMGSLLGAFLTTMAEIISTAVNTITMFTDMMAGGYGVGVDMWETFGISQWITIAIIFYPLYLVILWEEKGMDAVIQQLTWMFGLLSWLFMFFVTLIQFTIRLITTVIESIPVAE